jgi:long-chain fatty acid transport protein
MTLRRSDLAAVLGALSLVAIATTAERATATPLIETVGATGSHGGFAGVVSSPSVSSAYFNPAMLVDAPDELVVGTTVLTEQIGVTLDGRRAGADVPLAVGSRDIVGPDGTPIPNDTVPTEWLKRGCEPEGSQCPTGPFAARPRQRQGSSGVTHSYIVLGLLKNLVKDRAAVGLYMMLPVGRLTTAQSFYADQREQLFSNSLHPELYGDRLTAISIALGGSFRIVDSLALGVGTTFGIANGATSSTYVRDSTDYSTLLLNNDVGVEVSLSPHAGLYWTPAKWLRVGLAVHASQSLSIATTIVTTLPSGVTSTAEQEQVHDYMPWRETLGVELDVLRTPRSTFSLTASAQHVGWSTYEDRHGLSPASYGEDLGFSDTVNVSLGMRHRVGRVRGFVDFQFAPSPVPDQVGRSNYVDSDRFGATTGGDVEFELAGVKLRPGLSLLGYRLAWRHQEKDDARLVDEVPDNARNATTNEPLRGARGLQTNNPGWPGFGSDGWVFGGSLSINVAY